MSLSVDRYNRFTPIRKEYEKLLKLTAFGGNIINYHIVKGLLETCNLLEDYEGILKTENIT